MDSRYPPQELARSSAFSRGIGTVLGSSPRTLIIGFDSCRAMELVIIEDRVLKVTRTEVVKVKMEHFLRTSTRIDAPRDTRAQACALRIRDRLKVEIHKEESLDLIVTVDKPTDWMKNNGLLRICLDPRDLSKAIKREHYSCPTVEDVTAKLHGAQMFTVVDATRALLLPDR